jgi:hypothetical protein
LVGDSSFLGGIRSLTRSSPLASSKSQILCLGSTPAKAAEKINQKQSQKQIKKKP